MYSKAEVTKLKQDFWTVFGKYMSPFLSSEGEKVNWVNFKTGFKQIRFKMDANTASAVIAIEIISPDQEIQKAYFQKFKSLKQILESELQEEWLWEIKEQNFILTSRIYKEIVDVNILEKSTWPLIISFLKPRMIALDRFWNDAKMLFEELR